MDRSHADRWSSFTARLALGVALSAAVPAHGADLAAFNAGVAEGSRHQRAAEFYLRTGNPAVAAIELDGLAERWEAVRARYQADPPDAFAADEAWVDAIADVTSRIARAREAASIGDVDTAREALVGARGALASLRARNQVRVFADELDELDAAAAHLFEFRRDPPRAGDTARADELKARAAVVVYLIGRCRERAPPGIAEDPAFARALDEGLDSARRLVEAVNRGDSRTVVNDLRELRPIVRMLVLNYG